MENTVWLERTELLLGNERVEKLKNSHVLVVGLGGVGAYVAEQLCRAGIGQLTIVDGDVITESNRNRQLPALQSTTGMRKAETMAKRLLDINKDLKLNVIDEYLRDDRMIEVIKLGYDYIVDAIDTLSPKVFLIYHSIKNKQRIVSSMGAGAKVDPSQIQVTDISKSYNCKLARILRKKLHRLGIRDGVKVVFSPETTFEDAFVLVENEQNKKTTVGTISYMPPLFGCFCASVVIRDIVNV